MWTNEFKSLEQVKGIVSLIKSEEILEAFRWMNKERLMPLFIPKAKVRRYDEGNFCSRCDYQFQGEEADYHYCVRCGEELACCDNPNCDKDRQRAEESMISFLYKAYTK